MTDHWEIQGFIKGYGPEGRASWSTTRGNAASVANFFDKVLDEAEPGEVFLVRRGPQVEAVDGLIGPYQLVPVSAEERSDDPSESSKIDGEGVR